MLNENKVDMFYDPELDRKMVLDGFIVLPFLGEDEIDELRSLYNKWHPEERRHFLSHILIHEWSTK